MTHSTEEPSIEYSIYLASQADAVAAILADVFTRRDPLALAVGLTTSEFELFVRALLPKAAEERLTIVARLAESGEIVGAMLTNDPARETAEAMETLSEKFGPIGSILGELVATHRAGREPRSGEMLHLYLLGVSDRVAGNGIGQKLVSVAVENGAKRGYKLAVAEATNNTSQHIFSKLGFTARAQIPYRDFSFRGQKVFQDFAEHGGPILMEKPLAPTY